MVKRSRPSQAWSRDPLSDLEFNRSRRVSDTEFGVHLTVRISSETVEAAVAATRRAWNAVGPTGQLLLVFGLGIALGYTIAKREEVIAKMRAALPAVERISQMLSEGYTSYLEAVKDLPPTPTINASISREYQVARVLLCGRSANSS